ncbi:conserved protein of unknown function [Pseudomonas marincola]|uniref:Uncharacterized protein n=1 Tax=Pseudomonas marincola TaxID=437900 RepID=A0A653E7Q3_9PSED|nr:conserved protein of unknown function [Pseudomonas marincola]
MPDVNDQITGFTRLGYDRLCSADGLLDAVQRQVAGWQVFVLQVDDNNCVLAHASLQRY